MKLISILCSLVILASCKSDFGDSIYFDVETQLKQKGSCNVSLKSTFGVRWDECFIFDSMLYPEEISKAIGIPYSGNVLPDGKRRIIFLNSKKIVSEEDLEFSRVHFLELKRKGVIKLLYSYRFCAKFKRVNSEKHLFLKLVE